MASLDTLAFDNTLQRLLKSSYSRVLPQTLCSPCLVNFNPRVAVLIDLDPEQAQNGSRVDYFSGKTLLLGEGVHAMAINGM